MAKTKVKTTTRARNDVPPTSTAHEPVRSFCSRVINLCTGVSDAMKLTYLQGLKDEARRVMNEAKIVQSVYGGHPRYDLTKPIPTQDRQPKKSKRH